MKINKFRGEITGILAKKKHWCVCVLQHGECERTAPRRGRETINVQMYFALTEWSDPEKMDYTSNRGMNSDCTDRNTLENRFPALEEWPTYRNSDLSESDKAKYICKGKENILNSFQMSEYHHLHGKHCRPHEPKHGNSTCTTHNCPYTTRQRVQASEYPPIMVTS